MIPVILKKAASTVCIILAASFIAMQFPAVREFEIDYKGWAYLALFGSLIAAHFLYACLVGFVTGLFSINKKSRVFAFADRAAIWVLLIPAVWVTKLLLPDNVSITSPLGGAIFCVLIGLAIGIDQLIWDSIDASKNSSAQALPGSPANNSDSAGEPKQ